MFTARQKRRDNIAEYVLYMWQVEDLIRANGCEMEKVRTNILSQYALPGEELKELDDWWDNLVEMMKVENKVEKGHLQTIVNTVSEMNTLHGRLLQLPEHFAYHIQFQAVEPFVRELEAKTEPKPSNDIELMLTAIYHSFLLKLKGEQVSEATNFAIQAFARFLSLVSKNYRLDQEGKLDIED
jgi:hypothetical protein